MDVKKAGGDRLFQDHQIFHKDIGYFMKTNQGVCPAHISLGDDVPWCKNADGNGKCTHPDGFDYQSKVKRIAGNFFQNSGPDGHMCAGFPAAKNGYHYSSIKGNELPDLVITGEDHQGSIPIPSQ